MLTESAAILKYLSDKASSHLYPTARQARARVNERMDWINTQQCKLDLAIYPRMHAWLSRMKRSPHWAPTYASIEGYAASRPRDPFIAAGLDRPRGAPEA